MLRIVALCETGSALLGADFGPVADCETLYAEQLLPLLDEGMLLLDARPRRLNASGFPRVVPFAAVLAGRTCPRSLLSAGSCTDASHRRCGRPRASGSAAISPAPTAAGRSPTLRHSGRVSAASLARDRETRSQPVSDHLLIRHVPPGSTPLRELAHAIDKALTLPRPTARDEVEYLRCVRDRARLVRRALQRILTNPETDADDVMTAVAVLGSEADQVAEDSYEHESEQP
jgi:hypothetical protein